MICVFWFSSCQGNKLRCAEQQILAHCARGPPQWNNNKTKTRHTRKSKNDADCAAFLGLLAVALPKNRYALHSEYLVLKHPNFGGKRTNFKTQFLSQLEAAEEALEGRL